MNKPDLPERLDESVEVEYDTEIPRTVVEALLGKIAENRAAQNKLLGQAKWMEEQINPATPEDYLGPAAKPQDPRKGCASCGRSSCALQNETCGPGNEYVRWVKAQYCSECGKKRD